MVMNPEAKRLLNLVQKVTGCPSSLRQSSLLRVRIALQLFMLLGMWAVPRLAFSQEAAVGQISGQVRDQSGAAVPGAQITARNNATNISTSTPSNGGGYYSVQLPLGSYDVSASKTGFQELVQHNI